MSEIQKGPFLDPEFIKAFEEEMSLRREAGVDAVLTAKLRPDGKPSIVIEAFRLKRERVVTKDAKNGA